MAKDDIGKVLLQPPRSERETKADATTRAAQAITNAATAARDAKSERLRMARLTMEASQPLIMPAERKQAGARKRKK